MSLRKRSSKLMNSSSKHLFSGAYSLVSGSVSTKRKPENLKVRLVEHKIYQMKAFGEFEHLNDAFLKLKDLEFLGIFFLQSATAIFIIFSCFCCVF